ncbi:MAG: VWA domain-containing protein [Polyangiaceae bacterium]
MFNFVGVPLSQLLTLGAIAGGIVLVFYILKLKRRPVPVPFSKLWERILRDKEATSLFSQLKRLLSLLLQLFLLALLLLAMGDPRTAINVKDGRTLVVLIDASASMQATDVDPTRLEEGKRRVKEMVRGLGANDHVLIAQMDTSITPLSTMTSEIPELEHAIAAVQPTETRADFARGLRFAVDALRGQTLPEVVVVSDGALGPASDAFGQVDLGDIALSYIHVGNGDRNAAITAFSVRRYPLDKSRFEAMIEITNTSKDDLDLYLDIYGEVGIAQKQRLKVKAGERLPRFFPNFSGVSHKARAEISLLQTEERVDENNEKRVVGKEDFDEKGNRVAVHDDLPIDDVAYALMPERRRARIQVVSAGNMYLEAALLLDEYLDVTWVGPNDYPAAGEFDVTIFDNVAPALTGSSGHILYLNPTGKNVPFTVDKEILDDDPNNKLGFDEFDYEHPIARHTQLQDVQFSRAHVLKGQKEDKIIGASFKGPILIAGRRQGFKFVALGFDIRESDLPLRVSWPLFLLNTINDFVEEDTSYISSFATGTIWRIPAPLAEEIATLIPPTGLEARRTVPVSDGRAVYLGMHSGFYGLVAGDITTPEFVDEKGQLKIKDDVYRTEFAANLVDPLESQIKPEPELNVGVKKAGEVTPFEVGVRDELWIYLLYIAVAISCIEWITYHRRVTV